MNLKFGYRMILALAFLILFFSGVGCATTPPTRGPTPASSPSPALSSTATLQPTTTKPAPALTAPVLASPSSTQQPTRQTTGTSSTPSGTATPKPTKSAGEIATGWSNSRYLDYAHLSRGMTCETCHQTATPNARPAMQTCIDCHPSTVPAIGSRRRGSTPHNSHLGFLNCFQCHHAHAPFELYCNRCHAIMQTSRFQ